MYDFCIKYGMNLEQFYGREIYKGDLNLRDIVQLPLGLRLNVEGSVYLYNIEHITIENIIKVTGTLNLRGLKKLPLNVKFNVGTLILSNLISLPVGFEFIISGTLILDNVRAPLEAIVFNIGKDLILFNMVSINDKCIFNIGGDLIAKSLEELPENLSINVIGELILGKCLLNKEITNNNIIIQNNKYIIIKNNIGEIIELYENIIKCKKIASSELFYIIKSLNNKKIAIGDSVQEARENLKYVICDEDIKYYSELKPSDVLSFDDSITCYMSLSGACKTGVMNFCDELNHKQETYSIEEIINLTKTKYGNKKFTNVFTNINN